MDRTAKQQELTTLKQAFSQATAAVVLEFKGLKVEKDTLFRKSIRDGKGQYRVSKNTLLRQAVRETAFSGFETHFQGASGIATTQEDPIALAKAVHGFLKDNPAVTFKAAILDGKSITLKDLQVYAELPSREVLISKLLYLMLYPVSGLAVAMEAIRKQKEEAAA